MQGRPWTALLQSNAERRQRKERAVTPARGLVHVALQETLLQPAGRRRVQPGAQTVATAVVETLWSPPGQNNDDDESKTAKIIKKIMQ